MLKVIVAHDVNRVIGNGIKIPWHIKEDFLHFKQTTMGKKIIMGYTTYLSIGKLLPGRETIIVCNDENVNIEGAKMERNLDFINKFVNSEEEVFVCGGASIYRQLIDLCDELIISIVKKSYEGDIYFPEYQDKFEIYKEDEREEFTITYWRRKNA